MGVSPSDIAALPQTSVDVLPTRTIYAFANAHVRITLTVIDERGQEVSYYTDARINMTEQVDHR